MPSFASHHGRSLLHGHGDLSFCKKTKMIGTSLGSCFVEVNFCMFYFFLFSTESYCFSNFRVFYSSLRLSSFSNLVSCNWVVRVGVWHSQTPCRLHRPPPWPSKSLDLPTRLTVKNNIWFSYFGQNWGHYFDHDDFGVLDVIKVLTM